MTKEVKELFPGTGKTALVAIGKSDEPSGSRIGGFPPGGVVPPTCPRSGQPMEYLLTLEHEVVPLLPPGKAISIYVTPDPDALLKSMAVFVSRYPDIEKTVQGVFHDAAERQKSGRPSPVGGRSLVGSGIVDDAEEVEDDEDDIDPPDPVLTTKVGGRPGILQSSSEKAASVLEKNGYMFLFQFAENYPFDDMKPQTYLFGGGTLFIYIKCVRNAPEARCDFDDLVAFWEV